MPLGLVLGQKLSCWSMQKVLLHAAVLSSQHQFNEKVLPQLVSFPLTQCRMLPCLRNTLRWPMPFDAESVYNADESKSPRESPGRQTTYESPSQEYSENHCYLLFLLLLFFM